MTDSHVLIDENGEIYSNCRDIVIYGLKGASAATRVVHKMEKYKFDAQSIISLQNAICEEMEKYFKENPDTDEAGLVDHICREFKDRVDGTGYQLRRCTIEIIRGYFSVRLTLGNPDEFTTQQRSEALKRCPYFEAINKAIRFSAYYRNRVTGGQQQNPGPSLMNLLRAPSIITAPRPTGAQPQPRQAPAPVRPQRIPWLVTPGVSEALIEFMGDYFEQNPRAVDIDMERAAAAYLKIRFKINVGTADISGHLHQCEAEYHAVSSQIEKKQHTPGFNREEYIAQHCPFFDVMRIAHVKIYNSRNRSQSATVEGANRSGAPQASTSSSQPLVSPSKVAQGESRERKRAAPPATVTSSSAYEDPNAPRAAELGQRSGGHQSRRLPQVVVCRPSVIVEPIASAKRSKVSDEWRDAIAMALYKFFRKPEQKSTAPRPPSVQPRPPSVQPHERGSAPRPPSVQPHERGSGPRTPSDEPEDEDSEPI